MFVHCGVNNVKNRDADVRQCAQDLFIKLEKICELCPYARVTVSPILPTKFSWLNEKGIMFNRMLFHLCNQNPRVGTLDFSAFEDKESGLLCDRYGRYRNRSDAIHLGSTGIYLLSRLIIQKVFGSPIDGRLFRDIVSNPVQSGQRMSGRYKPRQRRSVVNNHD